MPRNAQSILEEEGNIIFMVKVVVASLRELGCERVHGPERPCGDADKGGGCNRFRDRNPPLVRIRPEGWGRVIDKLPQQLAYELKY